MFTKHDFTHSKHYILPTKQITNALYKTLTTTFNKLNKYTLSKNISLTIENHNNTSTTSTKLQHLLNIISFTSIKITYNPTNYTYNNKNPCTTLQTIKDRILYTH